MKASHFQDAVESSTRVFGRKAVNVVFQGSEAKTDGATVFLPALPAAAEITVDQADVIRGYRDHESDHVRCTDTSSASMTRLGQMERDENLGKLVQYCEDIRVEHAGTLEYPGQKFSLSAVNKHAAKGVLGQLESIGDPAQVITTIPPILQFRVALQSTARKKLGIEIGAYEPMLQHIKAGNPNLFALAEKFADEMLKLPTGYNHKTGALNEVEAKKGTAMAMDLGQAIYDAYGEFERNPPPPLQQQPEPEKQKQDGGTGEGQGKGQGQKPNDKDAGDKSDSDQGGKGEGEGKGEDQGSGGKPGSGKEEEQEQEQEQKQSGGGHGSEKEDDEEQGGQGSGADGEGEDEADGSGGQGGSDEGSESQGKGGGIGDGAGEGGNDGFTTDLPDAAKQKAQALDDLDDSYNRALKNVVKEINDSKTPSGVPSKFRLFSNHFSVKGPALAIISAILRSAGERLTDQDVLRMFNSQLQRFEQLAKSIAGKRAMIRRILELELQARWDRNWQGGHKSGRLHSVRLVDAVQGREAVFQKREDGREMDTMLEISIDGSGSMAGEEIGQALTLSYALCEALERTGCDIRVTMWGDHNVYQQHLPASVRGYTKDDLTLMNNALMSDLPRLSGLYTSNGVLTRAVIKPTNKRCTDPDVRLSFAAALYTMQCGTPSVHAVFADLADLAKENHSKKIYLHLTDGQAKRSLGQDNEELMKEAHALADGMGIHMIGIGINGMKVSHLFRDSVEVRGVDAYEPVIRKVAKFIAQEVGHGRAFKRAA